MIKNLPINEIKVSPKKLRGLNTKSIHFIGLRDSIKDDGFNGAILVREKNNPNGKSKYYELIDGLHRLEACKRLKLETIPAQIKSLEDKQVIPTQVKQNLHHIPTRNSDYAKTIKMMMSDDEGLTMDKIAVTLKVSPQWIRDQLRLKRIEHESIRKSVDRGDIPLSNAYYLSKLPPDLQVKYLEDSKTMKPSVFKPYISNLINRIKVAHKQGKDFEDEEEFKPVAYLQKIRAIKHECEELTEISKLIRDTGVSKPSDVAKLTLNWVLHLDPVNVRLQKAEYYRRKEENLKRRKARNKLKN